MTKLITQNMILQNKYFVSRKTTKRKLVRNDDAKTSQYKLTILKQAERRLIAIKESIESLLTSDIFRINNPELIEIYEKALIMIQNKQEGMVT